MLSVLVSILVTLKLEFTVINENSIAMPMKSFEVMTTSEEFQRGCYDGSIHDLEYYFDYRLEQEVIVTPDIDPNETK